MKIDVNLNDKAEVVLTAYGASVYQDYVRGLGGRADPAPYKAGDTYEAPLWEIAQIFGPVLYNGNPRVPFQNNRIVLETT